MDSALDLSDSVTAANRISMLHTEMKGLAEKLKSTEEEERVSASRLLRYFEGEISSEAIARTRSIE